MRWLSKSNACRGNRSELEDVTANPTRIRLGLPSVLSLLLSATTCQATPQETPGAAALSPSRLSEAELEVWNDPIFQKQFIASFGVNSEVEPRLAPDEIAILEKVRPLIAEDLPKAETTLQKQMKPECSAILDFTLGGIYFQQDKMPEALESYRKAVEKFPSFRRAWRNLGLIYIRNGAYDDAIEAFTRMIELGGGDAYSYGLLGFAYSAKQDHQASEVAYRNALLLQPKNTEWRLGVTRCVFKQQKFEDAVTLLEALIADYPEKTDFWLLQAQAYLGMKQPLRAAEDLEAVERLGKGTAESLHTLGDIYLNEGLMDLASRAYRQAIDAGSNQALARPLQSAEMLTGRGAFAQARQVVERIREVRQEGMDETDRRKLLKVEARLNMAEGLGSAETVGVLEEIVELDPLDGEALMLLGQHYSRQNEQDRAIFYYERAASIEAFEVNAKVRHAQALVSMGRYADAIPLLRRAQDLKPRDDVAQYLQQVERIAKSR